MSDTATSPGFTLGGITYGTLKKHTFEVPIVAPLVTCGGLIAQGWQKYESNGWAVQYSVIDRTMFVIGQAKESSVPLDGLPCELPEGFLSAARPFSVVGVGQDYRECLVAVTVDYNTDRLLCGRGIAFSATIPLNPASPYFQGQK